jgi:hypothetical protein
VNEPGDGCGDAQPLHASDRQVTGDTFLARDDVSGKCGGAGAGDVFYRLDVPRRVRVSARFDKEESKHVFILSRACADRTAEIACANKIDELLAPGTYFLAVDGQGPESFGKFQFEWRMRDIGGEEAACRAPPQLTDGQSVQGTTQGAGDHFMTSCGGREDQQAAPDRIYKLVLAQRSHVRLVLTTLAWDGVLALRRSCVDLSAAVKASELACVGHDDQRHATIDQTLDAGTYFVLVDGRAGSVGGSFTLDYKIVR